jgi:hypothetical protein
MPNSRNFTILSRLHAVVAEVAAAAKVATAAMVAARAVVVIK